MRGDGRARILFVSVDRTTGGRAPDASRCALRTRPDRKELRMLRWYRSRIIPAVLVAGLLGLTACTTGTASGAAACSSSSPASSVVINFAAYSTPREVYDAKII